MPSQFHRDIIELLSRKGIKEVVISPGSRSAPLTIAFARHEGFEKFIIPDERSAGFIAMGMAQKRKRPVVLLCTSGTAMVNYYPAVTEAFYQHIPLIVLSADRPSYLIDKWDGQTIRQKDLYKNHILDSLNLPDKLEDEGIIRNAFESINRLTNTSNRKKGPVHINAPMDDPLYPEKEEKFKFSKDIPLIEDAKVNYQLQAAELKMQLNTVGRVMIVVGQLDKDRELIKYLNQIASDKDAVILGDQISNIGLKENFVRNHDVFLNQGNRNKLQKPELLITLGKSVLSKNLKQYLRGIKNLRHWQVGNYDTRDTYFHLERKIDVPELKFIKAIQTFFEPEESFIENWLEEDKKAAGYISNHLQGEGFTELKALKKIIEKCPPKSNLHLANSLSVRYVNLLAHYIPDSISVFSNRGSSGIDGCSSTAVGHSLDGNEEHILITGDMAFFYDRNAFWHNHPINNLTVVILNNHGGDIFRMIKGPSDNPELEEYFVTEQRLNAENTAKDYGMDYHKCDSHESLEKTLKGFFNKKGNARILEIETNSSENKELYQSILGKFRS